jgi:2-amino-4-hydroxy-6-hydroxymethyldihydropteridine diphosphokinase
LELILLIHIISIMKNVYLGLGSNLGDRFKNLSEACIRIEESTGKITCRSSVYSTEPWGFKSENEFLNMVICVETDLSPSGLLGRILMIESQLGRIRCEPKYSSRKIDIDILLYDSEIVDEEALVVPHPKLPERKFVLVPLAEIAPGIIHPVLNQSVSSMLKSCKDPGKVLKYKEVF